MNPWHYMYSPEGIAVVKASILLILCLTIMGVCICRNRNMTPRTSWAITLPHDIMFLAALVTMGMKHNGEFVLMGACLFYVVSDVFRRFDPVTMYEWEAVVHND